ncbi:AraC family transcriptional regulator [Rubellicoccus peritrichatus]|uniref:AraC family transcriptional regulator n=1 Tax=Rubellicoccus peritrichatus TaxID=3080537 RepID=A0AAQ3LC70_9BACT|nr:AraC family transcriptional regulator [Puniceicoccus sp. CR14]WOO42731.1 AraC family transcriptional regulator [Puniceicoccus sp. CR14]
MNSGTSRQSSIYARLEEGLITKGGLWPLSAMRDLEAYAIVLIIRGGGTFESQYGTESLEAGSLLILFPGVLHRYYAPKGKPWTEYFIVFKGTLFDVWWKAGLLSPEHPVIQLEPVGHWAKRMQSIIRHDSHGSGEGLLEALRLQSFIADALAAGGQSRDDENRWVAMAREAIDQHLSDLDAVRLAADDLGMGYESFRKKFSQQAGQAPGQYRVEQLMLEAQRLLANSEQSIKEIADLLGFCDPYHFSKSFKAESGVSPSEYRKRRRDQAAAFWENRA